MIKQKRIEVLYACLVIDPKDKTEGIVGVMIGGQKCPLVLSDLDLMKKIISQCPELEKYHYKLAKFTNREDLKVFNPDST